MSTVIIVGAGLGGLTAAALLARRGHTVTLLERNESTGGKMGRWSSQGYTFDTGPTLVTMPAILRDLFAELTEEPAGIPRLERVDPICRYFYPDGTIFNACTDPGRLDAGVAALNPADVEGVRALLDHGERIYRAAAPTFLFEPFGSWDTTSLLRGLRRFPSLFAIDAFRTLDAAVCSFVRDDRLRQLFNRFATYNGSSPYRAPATLAIIPYTEFRMGGWYVRGGLYRIAELLEMHARRFGAAIRTGSEVRRILVERGRACGVLTAAGERLAADTVVCNADAVYAGQNLLGDGRGRHGRGLPEPSLAGMVLLLGVARAFPALAHHSIFFSSDYRAEFAALEAGRLAQDPTIYVSTPSAVEPSAAPPGHSAMFVLVNAPPLSAEGGNSGDDTALWTGYRNTVLSALERRGLSGLRDAVVVERMITPSDFARRFNAYRGSIYGISSNSRMSAFLRPPNRSRRVKGLYFAGGSAHPGGGVPLVILSGRMVADLVGNDTERR